MSTTPSPINLYAVYARHDNASRVVAGLAAASPVLAEAWGQLYQALGDIPVLGSAVARLSAELSGARMDRASLLAAIRATLQADADGEADPLAYLRDELDTTPGKERIRSDGEVLASMLRLRVERWLELEGAFPVLGLGEVELAGEPDSESVDRPVYLRRLADGQVWRVDLMMSARPAAPGEL